MREPLLEGDQQSRQELRRSKKIDPDKIITFRKSLDLACAKRKYQTKLFILMASYWISASFFIAMQFYLFKKPLYCEFISEGLDRCCPEGD